ncbi:hypothetical protein F8568_035335 [Actinomadura sp. LD22]|uniref:Uncharacterized protein n=1 Tax=Actinomadura physcomitrii TaxID=2650748 RepID=A0A6I4MH98_9ACTN|nr:hypothetical protein [Actinomadura physcomitrii]MWA05548.1 hypothetical protein [Actinomadura physcomitrii]
MRCSAIVTVGTAAGALLLTGCGGGGGGGDVAGGGTAEVSAPAIGATSTPKLGGGGGGGGGQPAPRRTGAPSRAATLGPLGYGALRLGMTARQLRGSGLLVGKVRAGANGCSGYDLRTRRTPKGSVGVYYSARYGIVSIFAVGGMRTPQGIGVGSTLAQVKHAYPKLANGVNGASAPVPGNPKAVYSLLLSGGRVASLALDLAGQNCHN